MDNPEKLAEMLQQQQAMKFLQSMQSQMNAPMSTEIPQEPMQIQDGMPVPNAPMDRRGMLQSAINGLGSQGSNFRAAGGQMQNIPVPQGVPEGFLNPQQTYQSGVNMTPLMLGANVPMGQGNLQANVMGSNFNAPGFSKTGINQVGLGYSRPMGGGTLTGTVNKPMQGSGVDAMLQYSKQF